MAAATPTVTKVRLLSGILVLMVVLLQPNHVQADFGLPMALPNVRQIIGSANGITGALDAMDRSFRRLTTASQTRRTTLATQVLSQITGNVTEMGKQLAGSVIRAVGDRSTPTDKLFGNLQDTYGQMNQYLTTNLTEPMEELDSSVGVAKTSQLRDALQAVNGAVTNVINVTSDVSSAISKVASEGNQATRASIAANVPVTLTGSLSKALGDTKNQLTVLTKAVEGILRDIGQANAYLAKFNQTKQTADKNIISSQQSFVSSANGDRDTNVKRYLNTRNSVVSDLSAAVEKLNVFSTNRTLLALYDRHSEEYTKIYYFLFNRKESDVANITGAYDSIGSNLDQMVAESNYTLGNATQKVATRLTDILIEQNDNGAACFNKFGNALVNLYPNHQSMVSNCINRERGRIGRIGETIDKMLQLVVSTSQDFAANVASCASQSAFATSEYFYTQAEACLTASVNEMPSFSVIVGAELDALNQMASVEVAASRFRLYGCVSSWSAIANAYIDVLSKDIDRCMSEDQGRSEPSDIVENEDSSEQTTGNSTDYGDYFESIETLTNSTTTQNAV